MTTENTATEKFEITAIQLMLVADENHQSGDDEWTTIKSYCANIAINDKFLVQCSGQRVITENLDGTTIKNEGEYLFSGISHSSDAKWNNADIQDHYFDTVDDDELLEQIEKNEDFENNFEWLKENGEIF